MSYDKTSELKTSQFRKSWKKVNQEFEQDDQRKNFSIWKRTEKKTEKKNV